MSSKVAFTVPYLIPPSVNHAWKPTMYTGKDGFAHRGRKTSPEVRAFKDAVAIFARGATVAPDGDRRKVRYGVRMDVYLGPKQRGDFDNFWKCGLDALVNCGVIHSDAAVSGDHSKCVVHKDDRANPRTEYVVTRLENE
jgi:Holliday junction resolvase RusA-like endonuclease